MAPGLGLERVGRYGFGGLACGAGRPGARPRQRLLVSCRSHQVHQDSLFIWGLGYSGIGVANHFAARGWKVSGTSREESRVQELRERGFDAHVFDADEFTLLRGAGLEALQRSTHVLSTIPPTPDGPHPDPVLTSHAQQLAEAAERLRWVGYVSSTSVYGDHEGAWVDETSELRATAGKGFTRLLAEHEWMQQHYEYGLPVHVFRCGGIYGPRRSALDTWAARGAPSASQQRRASQRHTSRCHVFDICQVLEASMRRPAPGEAYNIVDDDPAPRGQVMHFAAGLLLRKAAGDDTAPVLVGAGAGGEASAEAGGAGALGSSRDAAAAASSSGSGGHGHGARSAAESSGDSSDGGGRRLDEKRVRNGKVKGELGVRLAFPTYREGLEAIVAGDMRPFS